MTGKICILLAAAFLLIAPVAFAAENDGVIGTILEIEGSATVTPENGATPVAAALDTPLHLNDTVQTGANSKVFILFIDNTELTLSENTQAKIDDYIYDPEDNTNNKALYEVMQGAFQYVSGLIGKKDNPDVHIETPVGSIGIRGTDFWAGNLDGQYNVAVNEGQVALKTDGGEEVVNKGEGTSVAGRSFRPAPAAVWKPEKLQRIASTVHLQRHEWVRQRIQAVQGRQRFLQNRYRTYMKTRRPAGAPRPEIHAPHREKSGKNQHQNRKNILHRDKHEERHVNAREEINRQKRKDGKKIRREQ